MSDSRIIFTFEGTEVKIQCSKEDKMKDICQKYASKIGRNINSLVFLYGGNYPNFQISFKEQANLIDREKNEMNIIVLKNESDELQCPKCGEKINFNNEKINDIKSSINNINDIVKGAKLIIENIIKISTMDNVNVQLKNVNLIFNNLNEDIKKLNTKFDDLFNIKDINKEINFDNYIIAKIDIKDEDINKNIKIINSYEEYLRTNPGKLILSDIFNNEEEIKKCEIKINDEIIPFNYNHQFKTKGNYTIKYSFKNNLKNAFLLFGDCKLITYINLSNFNTNNINNMNSMFYGCSSLYYIDLSNINTNNVFDIGCIFRDCSSLTNINLSNFNTDNVINMNGMFDGCSSLKNIELSNFNTNNVTDMGCMFYGCSSLENINLSNFNINNVNNMNGMFDGCSSLKNIDLSNFNTNVMCNIGSMFYGCTSLTSINLSNFNTDNALNMDYMFGKCSSLDKKNIIIKDREILNDEELFENKK